VDALDGVFQGTYIDTIAITSYQRPAEGDARRERARRSRRRRRSMFLAPILSVLACLPLPQVLEAAPPAPIRVGMIGLDTSHVTAFAKIMNDPEAAEDVAGCPVVAAYPPGSDLPEWIERGKKFTAELEGMGVEMVDSIDALLEKVDVVMLMTVDGRPHLAQALPVLRARKPMYIDKPLAGSLVDAMAILELAERLDTPTFTASSLRYAPNAQAARHGSLGDVIGVDAHSPCKLEPHHPDLFWYGIHGVEMLYTAMGPGCLEVVRVHTAETDLVVGTWPDGRIGTFRGIRAGKADYGGTVFGTKGVGPLGPYTGYRPLVVEIVRFFRTHEPPIDAEEMLEIFLFMEAADESKRQGGIPVSLADVARPAREKATVEVEALLR